MDINTIGLSAGIALFTGLWIGHVLVRRLEYELASIRLPSACFAIIGVFLEIGSFLQNSPQVSAIMGILGMTALWDAFELFRQEKRVIKGHAPANPANPRHARLLENHPSATMLDLLKRDPVGHPVSSEEASQLIVTRRKPL